VRELGVARGAVGQAATVAAAEAPRLRLASSVESMRRWREVSVLSASRLLSGA